MKTIIRGGKQALTQPPSLKSTLIATQGVENKRSLNPQKKVGSYFLTGKPE